MTTLFAQPYDLDAVGFYFESAKEFATISLRLRNAHWEPVEEFEIQFIDGEDMDAELAKAVGINQANAGRFLEIVENWSDDDKLRYIINANECGYAFDLKRDDPNELDVDIYHLDSLRDLAFEFVEEGIIGDIPEDMRHYFDYDAFARDLAMDYSETTIAGQNIIYRCA